jgi:hypothetical protein
MFNQVNKLKKNLLLGLLSSYIMLSNSGGLIDHVFAE